jgi:4-hydroxy-tetrahydrodipicolinate synthase
VVTPFRSDEEIDYQAWKGLIDYLIAEGVHGLFVIGGQGEFFALSQEERIEATRFCVRAAGGRVPVFVNVGAVTTREAVRLAEAAGAEGADAVVGVTPYYLKPTGQELVEHYAAICQAVKLPVLAYNIPERSGVELTPADVRQIAQRCDNFAGLKDSSGKLELIPDYREAGLALFVGRDHMVLPALQLGASGAVAACANVVPRLFVDLYSAFQAGEMERAAKLQKMINPLRQAFGWATFPSIVKEVMNMMGVPVGLCRRPVGPVPAETRTRLQKVIDDLRGQGYIRSRSVAA